jgi:hypothetical protein
MVDGVLLEVGVERRSVMKIRRLTACRFKSGPRHHRAFPPYLIFPHFEPESLV